MRPGFHTPFLALLCICLSPFFANAQVYAPLENVRFYGYSYDMAPGFYQKPVYLQLKTPVGGGYRYTVAGGEGVKSYENKPAVILDSISTIALQIQSKGNWIDTIYVGTYFIRESITLPIVSLHLDRSDFDAPGGILDGKVVHVGDSLGVAILKTEGRVWKKENIKTYVEFMDSSGIRRLGNMRVQPFGGMTLGMPDKGIRLTTDTTLGSRNIGFNPFYGKPFNSYRTLVLRASGNDHNQTRMKDMTLCSIAKDLGLDYMDYRPSIVLVNGDYWGIYNIREKINYEFLYYNHKAPKNESTILLSANGGGNPDYNSMVQYIGKRFPEASVFDSLNSVMDLENYLNYAILQIHIRNRDSRGNIRFWKSSSLDDRWRWIFYDSDLSCEMVGIKDNFLKERLSPTQTAWYNPTYTTAILRNLTSHKPVRDLFINQYCLLLGTRLNIDTVVSRIDTFASILRPEIPHHAKRRARSTNASASKWEEEINTFKSFFPIRTSATYDHMMSTFGITKKPVKINITNNLPGVNNIRLSNTTWLFDKVSCKFFPEVKIPLEATDLNYEYVFERWKNDSTSSREILVTASDSLNVEAVYKKRNESPFRGLVFCDAWAVRESRKEQFFLFRIYNNSFDSLSTNGMRLVKNGLPDKIELPKANIPSGFACWFTNDPERAVKLVMKEPIVLMDTLTGFDLRGGTWFILDDNESIVDKITIYCPDSLYEYREIILATRNNISEPWSYHGRINPLDPHEPEFIAPINQNASGSNWHIPASFILFASCFYLLRNRRRIGTTLFISLLALFTNNLSAQPFCIPDRFGLDSIQTKLINNKGKGFEDLNGCRNIRVVLKNLLYRGGNNHPESYMNPLLPTTLEQLHQQGFDKVVYLYRKNFVELFPQEKLDSIKQTGLDYSCQPVLDSAMVYNFFKDLQARANEENPGMVYAHCWNGWHQSGRLAAFTLMQFCGYTNNQALRYWEMNTDGLYKGYPHVKKSIQAFIPYPDLGFTMIQQKRFCPCANDSLLNLPPVSLQDTNAVTAKYHVVKEGETLAIIAKQYKTTVSALKRLNQIKDEKSIRKGKRLRVR